MKLHDTSQFGSRSTNMFCYAQQNVTGNAYGALDPISEIGSECILKTALRSPHREVQVRLRARSHVHSYVTMSVASFFAVPLRMPKTLRPIPQIPRCNSLVIDHNHVLGVSDGC